MLTNFIVLRSFIFLIKSNFKKICSNLLQKIGVYCNELVIIYKIISILLVLAKKLLYYLL